MRRPPKTQETKTVTLSDDAEPQAEVPFNVLANPSADPKGYETVWERMMADLHGRNDAPLDHLGRTPKERQRYTPATDDLNDNSQADYEAWLEDMNLKPLEETVPAKTGESDKSQVLLFKDHNLEFPELNMRVHLVGPPEDTRGFPSLFGRAFCEQATDIHGADLVVFAGGPDVDPCYYGEKPVPSYYGDEERDYSDISAYLTCLEEGIPMFGVCRGAQFLAVMAGFKLVQDLDNHQTDHPMLDVRQNILLEKVSSVHHQSVIPGPGMQVLGSTSMSTSKWLNPTTRLTKEKLGNLKYPRDVEAYFIRETCAIGVQGHPEYKRYNAYAKWCLDLINEFVILNEDVEWSSDGLRRLKKEFVEEAKLVRKQNREILTAKVKEG